MVNQENFRFIQTLKAELRHKQLRFRKPAKTSRDVLTVRNVFYILLKDESSGVTGIGECAPIKGLSDDYDERYFEKLSSLFDPEISFENWCEILNTNSSILFGLETALYDFQNRGTRTIFHSDQPIAIPINGLVWMNGHEQMLHEAFDKINSGFKCIKLKVGGLDFDDELSILRSIRSKFSADEITIRLDANGAFDETNALSKLNALAEFDIHSIEQPIKAGKYDEMATIVSNSPIKIALDEELIGIHRQLDKLEMLRKIKPHYIILKPTLHGGIQGSDQWIDIARSLGIEWWATSALESNIGLNAIAQWVYDKHPVIEQGLGTGSLFEYNIPSPIKIESGRLTYDHRQTWDVSKIEDSKSAWL